MGRSSSRGQTSKNSPSTWRGSTCGSSSSPKLADPAWSLDLDPHSFWSRQAARLARDLGEPEHRVIEEHAARALARFYAGEHEQAANQAALADIAERLSPVQESSPGLEAA